MSNNKHHHSKPQSQNQAEQKPPVVEEINTTPPPPTEEETAPFTPESEVVQATESQVSSEEEAIAVDGSSIEEPAAEAPLVSEAVVAESSPVSDLQALLDEYSENMNYRMQYNRDRAIYHQISLVRVITDWVNSAKHVKDNADDFFITGRTLARWFAENSEDCCDPQMIYRGLNSNGVHGSPLKDLTAYNRYTAVCGIFYRLATPSQHAVLSGDLKQIQDHFKNIQIEPRFIELLSEGIRDKRI
jgi:hypothetical protein